MCVSACLYLSVSHFRRLGLALFRKSEIHFLLLRHPARDGHIAVWQVSLNRRRCQG